MRSVRIVNKPNAVIEWAHNLPAVGISLGVLGIQQHIRRMGIVLRLGGSMNQVPHVHQALVSFTPFRPISTINEVGTTNLWVS